MRKFSFLFIFIFLYTSIFSKEVVFNFNTNSGNVEFFRAGDKKTQSKYFYDGSVTLNLKDEDYYFLFSSPNHPEIQKVLDVRSIKSPVNIEFATQDAIEVKGVISNSSKNSLGGVNISFTNAQNLSYNFTTDIYGEYRAIIPADKYKVSIQKEGYILDDSNVTTYNLFKKSSSYTLDFKLKEISSFIAGRVLDENGMAISFPQISIKNGSKFIHIKGDRNGYFSSSVEDGIVTILAQKDGYIQNGVVKKIDRNSSVQNIQIPLTQTRFSISGVVTDDVHALANVKVTLMNEDYNKIATKVTSEDGFFEFYKVDGNQKVFLLISENNKTIKKSETITLDKDYHNFNLLVD